MESVGTLTWRGQDYESDFVAPVDWLVVGSVPESVAESAWMPTSHFLTATFTA